MERFPNARLAFVGDGPYRQVISYETCSIAIELGVESWLLGIGKMFIGLRWFGEAKPNNHNFFLSVS
jgi:hypothetical protein